MFARRSKIHMGSQVVAETPLMLPSFSSKGFPQIAKIMKLMGEFITGPILVSAYDTLREFEAFVDKHLNRLPLVL